MVLALMRRNVRYGADDEHLDRPLIAGFKSLRRLFATWDPRRWRVVEPLLCLRPFIGARRDRLAHHGRRSLVPAPSTSFTRWPNVAEAMGAVVEAVTGCRFEITDPASVEIVLARVLQVLLACVRAWPRGAGARQPLRLPSTSSSALASVSCGRLALRGSCYSASPGRRCKWLSVVSSPACLTLMPLWLPTSRFLVARTKVLVLERWAMNSNYVCLNSSRDEVGGGLGVAQDKAMMELFEVPCTVKILQFLCSLLNIAEDIEVNPRMNPIDFDEDVPLFALGLINSAIELSASSIRRHPKLMAFVQDELFHNLVQFGLSMSPLILLTICSVVFTLFYHLRQELKLQFEALFSCVILRVAQSRYGASYQQQEVILEALVDFGRQKEFMAEMCEHGL